METILQSLHDGSYATFWAQLGISFFTGWLPRLLAVIATILSLYFWIRRKNPPLGFLFLAITFFFTYAGTLFGA